MSNIVINIGPFFACLLACLLACLPFRLFKENVVKNLCFNESPVKRKSVHAGTAGDRQTEQ